MSTRAIKIDENEIKLKLSQSLANPSENSFRINSSVDWVAGTKVTGVRNV
jgi:hypothetical protein